MLNVGQRTSYWKRQREVTQHVRRKEKQIEREARAIVFEDKLRPNARTGEGAIRPRSVLAMILQHACRLPQPFSTSQLARSVNRSSCNVSCRLHWLEEFGYVELVGNRLTGIVLQTPGGGGYKSSRWMLHWRVK